MFLKFFLAFLVGGSFCALAQILIDKTALTPAKILVVYVSAGVVLGGTGIYDTLFKLAGAGATLPLVGFGGNLARGVREAVDKTGLLGALSGPFEAMSAGVGAALLLGLLFSFLFKAKRKKMKSK